MGRLTSGLSRLLDATGVLGMWMLVPVMLLVLAEVVLRSAFGHSLIGVNESVEFLLLAYVFLGLGRSIQKRVHVTVSLLTERMPARPRRVIDGTVALAAATVWLLACWQTLLHARHIQLSRVMSPTVEIPIHPFIYMTGLGCGLVGLALIAEAVTLWRGQSWPKAESAA